MNNDLISREALKKHKITTTIYNGIEPENIEVVPVASIDNAPTVDTTFREVVAYECGQKSVERPQGKWIDGFCNKCGGSSLCDGWGRDVESNFCPNCGAKMRKGDLDCMDEDAKQASIPYTYNVPQHDWKCGYPDITESRYYQK